MAHLVFLEALALSFAAFFYLLFQVIRFLILPFPFNLYPEQLLLYNDHGNVPTKNSNILTHCYLQLPISFHIEKKLSLTLKFVSQLIPFY